MVRKILGNFGVRLLTAIFNLLIAVIVSQYIGAVGKGEQSIVLTMIALISIFDNMVGGASIVYLTNKLKLKELFVASYLWTFFIGSLTFLLLHFVELVPSKFVFSVVLLSTISSVISIHSSVLLGKEKLSHFNLLSFLIPVMTFLALLIQFVLDWNRSVEAYVYALYVAYGFTFVLSIYFIRSVFKTKDHLEWQNTWYSFKSLFFFGFQNQLAHIFQLLSFRISYFFLEKDCGSSQVGIYSNAVSVIESIWMISTSISLWQYATISNSTDVQYTKKITEQLTKYGLLIAFLGLLVLLFIPNSFFSWLFGKEFTDLNQLFWRLAPGIWVFNYALIIGHYFSGHGKYYVNAIASGIGLLLTCIAASIFIPWLNIHGAAITASISYFGTSLVVIYYFRKEGANFVVFPTFNELKWNIGQLKQHLSKRN
jgi:O-antigen/teichoic acid export membrane protein